MLLNVSDHSRGATLPWCDALVDRVACFRWGAVVPLVAPDEARRPTGVPVDCPLLQLTRDALREMCSAVGPCSPPSSDLRGTHSRRACFACDDAHTCPFDFLCPIGNGSFGTVQLVQSRVYPTRFFAAKSVTRPLHPAACAPMGLRDGDEAALAALRQAFSGTKSGVVASHFPGFDDIFREARVAAALPPHPHISRCYGVLLSPGAAGKTGDVASFALHSVSSQTAGGAHMLMELGAGGTLGDLFKRRACHIAEEHLACWLGQLLRGLACLHKGGVIHRDIKPSNILVRRRASTAWESDTELFFVDFGISALIADSNCETERTVIGSGAYCPPEIARYWGYRRRCAYSYASDVWSTAALFYVFVTCGAASMEDGMAAVFSTNFSAATDSAMAAQFRVARGEYPTLVMLKQVPLLDDGALRLAQEQLAGRSAGADGGFEQGAYTHYTTVADEAPNGGECESSGGWPAWVFSPAVQLMARHLRVRELSVEFLSLIDSMMALNPAERPTAEAVLLDSPVFGMRLPWWEKVVEKAMQRVVEGVENVLLDVCVGDSDEEEEEDEEEAALVRRTMAPLVSPAENHGYVPHNVVHWWDIDLTRGEPDHTKWLPPTSLLASLLTTLRDLTGFEATGDALAPVRREVPLYTVTSLRFLERVWAPVCGAELSSKRVDDGPLFSELKARGWNTDFIIHVQIKLSAVARAGQVLMRNGWTEDEDVADEEEMARRAMEVLVAATETWLRHREAITGVVALHVLPWVSWHLGSEAGGTGGDAPRCFTVEYIAAGPREDRSESAVCKNSVTGDLAAVFRDWRANVTNGLQQLSCGVDATAVAAEDVRRDQASPVQRGIPALEQSFEAVLGALEVSESELIGRQKRNEAHHGLLQGHVVPWLSTRPAPSVERCVDTLRGVRDGAGTLSQQIQEWILTTIFTTEGAMALMPRPGISGQTDSLP
ncbi:putative serine/threonine protein kinase [Trypanosoma rangeli]|uniref:Putative serine/threonine protein kinase n=1 Tax=Trypanosoma rangeli TaxID=5698 RepID=A0A422N3K9_TRYRA|nr:putative serine/threonine protein kinase [Trypanosoma rangeli]RNF00022.1 putative serine/threonine protein kinase [Trypanosoma rangeli]|eukprot:RNF00022.1 putative serine/threonine protein kinase [Trypanosoma rangeli]